MAPSEAEQPQAGPAEPTREREIAVSSTATDHLFDEKTRAILEAAARVPGLQIEKQVTHPEITVVASYPAVCSAVGQAVSGVRNAAPPKLPSAQTAGPILVAVSANDLPSRHDLLALAMRQDPNLQRTFGVIINPHLVKPGGETSVMHLLESKDECDHLPLGWHVLRSGTNGEQDAGDNDWEHSSEAIFFRLGAWSQIPAADAGMAQLRKKLSRTMYENVQKRLPSLIATLETRMNEGQRQLLKMGKPRITTMDLRNYMLDIALDFERLVRTAVEGRYDDPFFGSTDDVDLKLRTHLRNMARAFGATMQLRAATYDIIPGKSGDRAIVKSEDHGSKNLVAVPEYMKEYMNMYTPMIPCSESITEEMFSAIIQQQAINNQAHELSGTGNMSLVMRLFRIQSWNWEAIACAYAGFVSGCVRGCVEAIVRHKVGSANLHTLDAILNEFVEPRFARQQEAAMAKISEFMRAYTTTTFSTPFESEFRSRLASRTVDRLSDHFVNTMAMEMRLQLAVRSNTGFGADPGPGNREKLKAALRDLQDFSSFGGFGTEKIIDMMQTYYEMSLRTFTDNVVNLAVEPCLVSGITGILTPQMVGQMSDERLKELAGESEDLRKLREKTQKEVDMLEEALGVCRPHQPKEKTVLPFLHRLAKGAAASGSSATPSMTAHAPHASPQVSTQITPARVASAPSVFGVCPNPSILVNNPFPHPNNIFAGLKPLSFAQPNVLSNGPGLFATQARDGSSPSTNIGNVGCIGGFATASGETSDPAAVASGSTVTGSAFVRGPDAHGSPSWPLGYEWMADVPHKTYWSPCFYYTEREHNNPSSICRFHNIGFAGRYQQYSMEEIRLRDYTLQSDVRQGQVI